MILLLLFGFLGRDYFVGFFARRRLILVILTALLGVYREVLYCGRGERGELFSTSRLTDDL